MAETEAGTDAPARAPAAARGVPDFSALALQHLEQRCDTFRQHVREHLERPSAPAPLAELADDLHRFRNTLVLLERTGAVFVAEELLALLGARGSGGIEDEDEFARVMVAAGERLGDHVARLAGGRGAIELADGDGGMNVGALALLPLVNDSRACRDAPLLSEALLLAAGITVPEAVAEDAPGDDAARETLVAEIRARRPTLLPALRDWFRAVPGGAPAAATAETLGAFDSLAALCTAPALAHVAPALEAAAVLARAVRDGTVADGTAPRRLFAQLERWLHDIGEGDGGADGDGAPAPPSAPPAELQRNLLYYVALVDPAEPRVAALHERFGLGRVRPAIEAAAIDEAGGALGTRLSGAIRDSLDVETSGLRQWLEQAPTAADHPHVIRLRERLSHLEPVLTLLGAREARRWLRRINETLESLSGEAPVGAAERLMLAESLIRLDRALDAAGAVGRVDPGSSVAAGVPSGTASGGEEGEDTAARMAVDEAIGGCLAEARRRLLLVGESLDAPRLVGSAGGDAQLETIERALSVVDLPDVLPLLRGLRAANVRIDADAPPEQRETLATLIASLEFYLGCVLHTDADGSRGLLHDAEEALARLEARLPSSAARAGGATRAGAALPGADALSARVNAGRAIGRRDGAARAPVAHAGDAGDAGDSGEDDGYADATLAPESGALTSEALVLMDRIGQTLADRDGAVTVAGLRVPFDALADIGARGGIDGMRELATAAVRLLDRVALARGGDGATLPANERALLDEAHAVLPQLIERAHGSSENVRGLETLVQDLRGADPLPEAALGAVLGAAFEEADLDDSDASTLDNTLQQVFRRECAMHIDTLERAVARAVASIERTDGGGESLPSDAMLRALHTLSGSAQTVDARHIVAVVRPLQRVALARHRSDVPFDASETRYVGELVGVLRARLDVLESDGPVDDDVLDAEARLGAFVDAALAVRHEDDGDDSRSLDSVFDEEARELLARWQTALSTDADTGSAIDRALGHLHTLKGSARMAGRHALAERAHALEGLVQGLPSDEARRRTLLTGRRELQVLLLDTTPLAGEARNPDSWPPDGRTPDDRPHEGPPRESRAPESRTPEFRGVEPPHGALATGEPGAMPSDRASASAARAVASSRRADEPSGAAADTASLSATTFENLLTLATDVTVSQARLSDDIARVREICRDLESAAGRWRRLPHEAPLLESPAAREMLADLETARRGLSDSLRLADVEQQHASRAASSLQQTLIRTRLVRVDELTARLAEAVRDATEATGREARFVVEGGDITLDGALCRQLRAPLEHLVRNAVVHGIESPATRRANGKDPLGTVRLSAAIDGTEIVLAVEDDGAGIDREAVSRRREASGHGAVGTVDALQDVLCEAGFTTLDAASAVGGRGLGLSAVGEALARLDGRLHIGTRTGEGTVVTCRLRQRIIVNQVVLVRCARRLYALPVNVVRRVGAEEGDVRESDAHVPGTPPRHSLLALLGGVPPPHGRDEGETDDTGAYVDGSAELVVEVGGRAFVLEVDRVLGYRELLTQPLGPQLAALRRYAGGSVLPDGRQVLVIELDRLVGEGGPGPRAAARPPRRDPESMRPIALVVDDSITMRVAAAGMLGRHGVETREARDGIDALDSLERALPDLMIVDLDMPRLGGFDLIRRVRERFGARVPPIVVVTSRDGAEDREHAVALGVVRYLTKPYTEHELHEALIASGLRLPDLTIA